MAEPKFIYADFMKCDYENHLILSGLGTHKDLAKYNIILENGLKFVFYNVATEEKQKLSLLQTFETSSAK